MKILTTMICISAAILLSAAGCHQAINDHISPMGDGRIHLAVSGSNGDQPKDYTGVNLSLSIVYGQPDDKINVEWDKDQDGKWIASQLVEWKNATTPCSVYAYAPYCTGITDLTKIPFSIQNDQSKTQEYLSDLVGCNQSGPLPSKELSLTFTHRLSKLNIEMTLDGNITEGTTIKSVTLNGLQMNTLYNAQTGALSPAPDKFDDLRMACPDPSAKPNHFEGILIPQTVKKGKKLVTVQLSDNRFYSYTLDDDWTFEPNREYTLNLNVRHPMIIILDQVTVNDWTTGDPIDDGNADAIELGDFLYLDGKTTHNYESSYGVACVGIVFKVGKDDDGSQYEDNGKYPMTHIHGYAIGLYFGTTEKCTWSSTNLKDTAIGTDQDITGDIAKANGFYGYGFTQKILAKSETVGGSLQTNFPACYYCTDGYEANHDAPSNSSGWYMPSIAQVCVIYQNRNLLDKQLKAANGDTFKYESDSWLWSSTETSGTSNKCWVLDFCTGQLSSNGQKQDKNWPRPVLTF